MGKVNALGSNKLRNWNMFCLRCPSLENILPDYLFDFGRERFYSTFIPTEQVIKDVCSKLIFIFWNQDLISALSQII